jgi:hypothetical protein
MYYKNRLVLINPRKDKVMEKWRSVWRIGLAPQISRTALHALASALRQDDRRLMQGAFCAGRGDIVGACAIGYCGWQGEGCSSAPEVESYYHRVCEAADAAFDEPAACRFFLQWFDAVPRPTMRRELLAEVTLALRQSARSLACACQ